MRLIDADKLGHEIHCAYSDDLEILEHIDEQPTAQPPMIDEWCDDCKEYDPEKHCCPRWNRVIRQTAEDMKAAQPQLIRCKDCKYYHSHYCGIWSQYGTIRTKEDGYCYMAERATE